MNRELDTERVMTISTIMIPTSIITAVRTKSSCEIFCKSALVAVVPVKAACTPCKSLPSNGIPKAVCKFFFELKRIQ